MVRWLYNAAGAGNTGWAYRMVIGGCQMLLHHIERVHMLIIASHTYKGVVRTYRGMPQQ